METVLSSLFLKDDNLHALKLSALYCDKIIIPEDYFLLLGTDKPLEREYVIGEKLSAKVRGKFLSISDEIVAEIKPLVDEGVVLLNDGDEQKDLDKTIAFQAAFDEVTRELLEGKGRKLTWEVNPELALFSRQADSPELYDLFKAYFSFVAETSLVASAEHSCPVLTDSSLVNAILMRFLKTNAVTEQANLAKIRLNLLTHRVVSEFVPNVGDTSVHDVLELRYKLRDDLQPFRAAMGRLSGKVRSEPWTADIKKEVDRLVETEVRPNLINLKRSLQTPRLAFAKKTFDNLKNAPTYVPFIGTVLAQMDPLIAAAGSAGIAGFKALLDLLVERQKLRDASGLVFLLNAPRKLWKVQGRR